MSSQLYARAFFSGTPAFGRVVESEGEENAAVMKIEEDSSEEATDSDNVPTQKRGLELDWVIRSRSERAKAARKRSAGSCSDPDRSQGSGRSNSTTNIDSRLGPRKDTSYERGSSGSDSCCRASRLNSSNSLDTSALSSEDDLVFPTSYQLIKEFQEMYHSSMDDEDGRGDFIYENEESFWGLDEDEATSGSEDENEAASENERLNEGESEPEDETSDGNTEFQIGCESQGEVQNAAENRTEDSLSKDEKWKQQNATEVWKTDGRRPSVEGQQTACHKRVRFLGEKARELIGGKSASEGATERAKRVRLLGEIAVKSGEQVGGKSSSEGATETACAKRVRFLGENAVKSRELVGGKCVSEGTTLQQSDAQQADVHRGLTVPGSEDLSYLLGNQCQDNAIGESDRSFPVSAPQSSGSPTKHLSLCWT